MKALFHNKYEIWCLDHTGREKWRETVHNLVTTEGSNYILNAAFKGGTQISSWFAGLINNSPSPSLSSADTMAQIGGTNGWTEFTTYSGSRKALTLGTVASGSVATSSVSAFAVTGSATLYGLFVVSAASGTSGTLYGESAFASTQAVSNGDTVNLTVTLSLS